MIEKKIVVITGGLGDIGQATAVHFGKNDYRVAICDQLKEEEAYPAIQQLSEKGCSELLYHTVDVTNEEAVKQWYEIIENRWGIPQVIIPNAGIVVDGCLSDEKIPTADVRRQMEVNFWGAYHVAVLGSKILKKKELPGRIVFIGSWVAERPIPRISAYGISKASLRMLSKTLAMELAKDDILVNEVAPGIVDGGLSKSNQKKNSALLQKHLNAIPVHKLIPVEEVVREIWRLSDFDLTSITGSIVVLDGGLSLTSKMTS